MPRLSRIVLPGHPHHVTQRARAGRRIFTCEADYRLYLRILAAEARRFGLRVLAYCLLPDRVHLVAVPRDEAALANAVGRTHALYAREVNRDTRRLRSWEPRFQSCALGGDLLTDAICHVERQAVRARVVRCPWRYPWSSAAAHVGLGDPAELLDLKPLKWWIGKRWKEYLGDGIEPETELHLHRHTRRGWPLASEDELRDWERRPHRRLRPLPVGRPRKPPPRRRDRRIPFW